MQLTDFIHGLRWQDVPAPMQHRTRDFLVDLLGVATGGIGTRVARIICEHAADQFAPGSAPARMLLDGRKVSPAGAALAGGMTIDAYDAHDGHRLTKGHAGCAALPAAMAMAEATGRLDGGDLLVSLLLGYEIGTRAGIALHRTACDYHTSGAWTALSCSAIGARYLGLAAGQTRHALGIAEYHGPRSQMMRCIDHPTMLKDGSGWGAMVGLSAADLAASGFTGAPALVVESAPVAGLWSDLGSRWRITEMYFKPYPVCRWAQPAIEAALGLRRAHGVAPQQIAAIEVETFHEAVRLDQRRPASTEEAQYSLPFPVAVAMVKGRLAPTDISGAALGDPAVLAVSDRVILREADDLNARFPAERLARVTVRLADGRALASDTTPARGDAERPLSDGEIMDKYTAVAEPALGGRAGDIAREIAALADGADVRRFLDLVLAPAP